MQMTFDIQEDEILEKAKQIAADSIALEMIKSEFSVGRVYRNIIKDVVREVIRANIEELSDRAVRAASVSIENRALKGRVVGEEFDEWESEEAKPIGERIQARLGELGMSQSDLAKACNITEVSISRYANGQRVPKATVLAGIAKALSVPLDYFFS